MSTLLFVYGTLKRRCSNHDQLAGQTFLRRSRPARPRQGERHLINTKPGIRRGVDYLKDQPQQAGLRRSGRPIGSDQPIDQAFDRPRAHRSNLDVGYDRFPRTLVLAFESRLPRKGPASPGGGRRRPVRN